ncbi:MAG: phage major capsid protein [Rhodospirillales bacterium]|nr:phage major capsid protein [Rhodospirillales bacterium]
MNETIRAALRAQAEARAAWNALPEDAEDAQRTEARAALEAADQAVIEALDSAATAPPELRDRISLGRYLEAIAGQTVPDGAEAELRQELNLSDQAVPLEALLPTPEERADAVSPQDAAGNALAAGTINISTGPMLTRLFTATDAAFLGVSMPTVPAGQRRYPVMVGGTTAAMQARGAEPDAGAAKFTVVDASPHRLTGRYVLDLEGVAEMGGLLESTLRGDLRTEMGYQLDLQIFGGSGADAQVNGILNALDLDNPPGTAKGKDSAQLTWANARQIATDGLDGKLARTERDIRLLIGGATYSQMRQLYRNNDAEIDAIGALAALGTRVSRSFQMPAPGVVKIDNTGAAAADSTKQHQRAIANSEPGAAVAPVWQGITIIRDPYSNAGKAQVVLTAHMMFDFLFRRKDGWHQYAINVANTGV